MFRSSLPAPSPEAVFTLWLEELQADDRASGTIRRYRSAVESFLGWYRAVEQRPLQLSALTPMTLVAIMSSHEPLSENMAPEAIYDARQL